MKLILLYNLSVWSQDMRNKLWDMFKLLYSTQLQLQPQPHHIQWANDVIWRQDRDIHIFSPVCGLLRDSTFSYFGLVDFALDLTDEAWRRKENKKFMSANGMAWHGLNTQENKTALDGGRACWTPHRFMMDNSSFFHFSMRLPIPHTAYCM